MKLDGNMIANVLLALVVFKLLDALFLDDVITGLVQ